MIPEADKDDDSDDNNSNHQENGAGSASLEWFPAYNGMNQTVLDEFSKITGLGVLNATYFQTVSEQVRKSIYASPHAVGCYLSHWRLLEKVRKSWGKPKQAPPQSQSQNQSPPTASSAKRKRRPDMLFVFEDDAHCVTNLIDRTWKVVQRLPKDWDILYIGGKPFSYHTQGKTIGELSSETATVELPRPTDQELLDKMCQGGFGTSYSGPFAPGTSAKDSVAVTMGANLPKDPPYWQIKWIFNTNAYVINPKRIQRVLRVLSAPQYDYKPIDVLLSNDIFGEFFNPSAYENNTDTRPLQAFLTPNMYCDQEAKRTIYNRDQPPPWEGFFWLPWQTFSGFPNGTAYVWSKMATRTTCPNLVKEKTK